MFYKLFLRIVLFKLECLTGLAALFIKVFGSKKFKEIIFSHKKIKAELSEDIMLNPESANSKKIWFHAASVGEVNAVTQLLKTCCETNRNEKVFLSVMTKTGLSQAKKNLSDYTKKRLIFVFRYPYDFYFQVKDLFEVIKPDLIVLVETEFWPNMLSLANKRNIPMIIVNGRISDRSLPNYFKFAKIWQLLWQPIKEVSAQSEPDAKKFQKLGFSNVTNNLNLKYSSTLPDYNSNLERKNLGFTDEDFVIVWGSSRPGEEKLILSLFPILQQQIGKLKLVIVPRHLNRLEEIYNLIDFSFSKYSENKVDDIMIIDEMGVLNKFYAISNLAIVGGSFFDFGGHNPLEPAFYSKPIIIGQFHASCKESVITLAKNNAIIVCENSKLKDKILYLFNNYGEAISMGLNAKKVLNQFSNSLQKNLEVIRRNAL
ncbi:MAG: glycosyltransferase N-terminal domain-containing protein [Candidatus Cloacimonetes bacterium]|nr:glycosyltransferase N-terminal domain-containing protein [Candidatus Cloacimonadota bacterium]